VRKASSFSAGSLWRRKALVSDSIRSRTHSSNSAKKISSLLSKLA
jgi:hypothetical protein